MKISIVKKPKTPIQSKYSFIVNEYFDSITEEECLKIECDDIKECNRVYASLRNYMSRLGLFEKYKLRRPGYKTAPETSKTILVLLKAKK